MDFCRQNFGQLGAFSLFRPRPRHAGGGLGLFIRTNVKYTLGIGPNVITVLNLRVRWINMPGKSYFYIQIFVFCGVAGIEFIALHCECDSKAEDRSYPATQLHLPSSIKPFRWKITFSECGALFLRILL